MLIDYLEYLILGKNKFLQSVKINLGGMVYIYQNCFILDIFKFICLKFECFYFFTIINKSYNFRLRLIGRRCLVIVDVFIKQN